MKRRVRLLRVAQRDIDRAKAWWLAYGSAPTVLEAELANAYAFIAEFPHAVQLTSYRRRPDVRAYSLPVTGYRLFFVISDDDRTIYVLRLRHPRRRPV